MLGSWFRRHQAKVPESADSTEEARAPEELVSVELAKIGGPPELDFLFIDVSDADIQRALDGWTWVDLQDLTAIAVSAFGEVFFRAADGSIRYLDTIEGKLSKVAESLGDLTAQLQEVDRRDELLLAGMVIGARAKGLLLREGECYDFLLAPVLGGEMSSEQMQTISFVVKVHLAGQLHEQVKDLPPGTRITNVTIAD